MTKTPKYPGASCSVAISFVTKPTKKQIALMKTRAALFAANMMERDYSRSEGYTKDPRIGKILGYRLIEQTIVRTLTEGVV